MAHGDDAALEIGDARTSQSVVLGPHDGLERMIDPEDGVVVTHQQHPPGAFGMERQREELTDRNRYEFTVAVHDAIGREVGPRQGPQRGELVSQEVGACLQARQVATARVHRRQSDELVEHRSTPRLEIGDELIGLVHARHSRTGSGRNDGDLGPEPT